MIILEHVILNEILPKLAVKSLMRFKCVSKTWLTHISNDPHLINSHLKHNSNNTPNSIILKWYDPQNYMTERPHLLLISEQYHTNIDIPGPSDDKIKFVGSCNGLVCLKMLHKDEFIPNFVLWNPATRQFRNLPNFEINDSMITQLGFGFDQHNDDYKIVNILSPDELLDDDDDDNDGDLKEFSIEVKVFSKKSGIWRSGIVEAEATLGYCGDLEFRSSVLADGALHWLVKKIDKVNGNKYIGLLSFYLRDEMLKVTYLPHQIMDKIRNICKWKDWLVGLEFVSRGACCLWIAKFDNNNNNNNVSWTKMMNVNVQGWKFLQGTIWRKYFLVIGLTKKKRVLKLGIYNEYGLQFELMEHVGPLSYAHDYIETLVSVF